MHIFVPEKRAHSRKGGFFWGASGASKFKSALTALPLLWQIWIPQKGWECFHSSVIKNLPTSFLLSSFPPPTPSPLLGHSFFPLPRSRPSSTLLTSFVIFPLIPLPNIVLTFQVPHSSARHTDLPAGLPEEFLACDYPLIFHLHTHTHAHTPSGGNKLMEWAVLFYYLWRKVYCFLLQGVELIYWHIPKCPNAIDLLLSDQSGEICVFLTDAVWQAEHVCVCVCVAVIFFFVCQVKHGFIACLF